MCPERIQLETTKLRRINTDPQRRCYNGCHAKSELVWDTWDWLEWNVSPDKVEERLRFWRDLNKYSVSVGGSPSKYRVVIIKEDKE